MILRIKLYIDKLVIIGRENFKNLTIMGLTLRARGRITANRGPKRKCTVPHLYFSHLTAVET